MQSSLATGPAAGIGDEGLKLAGSVADTVVAAAVIVRLFTASTGCGVRVDGGSPPPHTHTRAAPVSSQKEWCSDSIKRWCAPDGDHAAAIASVPPQTLLGRGQKTVGITSTHTMAREPLFEGRRSRKPVGCRFSARNPEPEITKRMHPRASQPHRGDKRGTTGWSLRPGATHTSSGPARGGRSSKRRANAESISGAYGAPRATSPTTLQPIEVPGYHRTGRDTLV